MTQKKQRISKKFFWLALLFFFTLLTRLFRLNLPTETYFDEAYHVPAARLIASNDQRAYEWWHEPIAGDDYHDWLHPPLAKFIQAGSILVFGDNAWGWRLPSAVFGSFLVLALYFLAKEIFLSVLDEKKSHQVALTAAALLSLDGLPLVQSRIAMNDVMATFWMAAALLFITRWQPRIWLFKIDRFREKQTLLARGSHLNLILSGLFVGLALGTKWSSLLLLIFLLFVVAMSTIGRKLWKLLPLVIFSLILLPFTIYVSSYTQMFVQGKSLEDFVQLHRQIIWYQTNRDADHDYHSLPYEWVLNYRPVWYWTQEKAVVAQAGAITPTIRTTANIYALGNPVIHLLAVVVLIYQLGWIINYWSDADVFRHRLALTTLYLLFWIPWLLSPRIIFYHLYLPALIGLSMILARFMIYLYNSSSRWIYWTLFSLIFISFVVFYPHWTGLEVAQSWAERVYFVIPSWR